MGKAPGLDGFMSEHYKQFKYILAPRLQKVFAFVFESKIIPSSWSKTFIVLIPKEGKDASVPQSLGLISSNVDYKILTSVLAAGLMNFLGAWIHQDQ